MIKPTLDNFDTIWIKTAQCGKRTACIVKNDFAKSYKKAIKLADALTMIGSMNLDSDSCGNVRIQVYSKLN